MTQRRLIFPLIIIASLGASALFGRRALSDGARRLGVQCAATDGAQRTSFVCSLLDGSGADNFIPDPFGGVVQLQGVGSPDQAIEVDHARLGPSGRGGARRVNGDVEVVDGAGRVTFKNFQAQPVLPFSPSAASVGIFGDAQSSPVSLNMLSPVEGVTSGKAVFIGDADNISIDISGKNGAPGRSAGVSAAFQVLRGELGQSDSIKALVDKMGLGPVLSEPELTVNDLSDSVGLCEQIPGGLLKTPSPSSDGVSSSASTSRAKEILVQRSSCQRQTSQEFSIQTICSRPAEITSTLRCEYPNIVRDAAIWRRPTVNQKISLSCSESVPFGTWSTTCSVEQFAVAGSVIRPEYVTLAPTKTILHGMAMPLFHHLAASGSGCDVDAAGPRYLSYITNKTPGDPLSFSSHSFSRDFVSFPAIATACDGSPMNKMDVLRTTGALVYRYARNEMPGTSEEQQDGPEEDITKLSYWADRSTAPLDSAQYHRVPYDDLNGNTQEAVDPVALSADKPFSYSGWDPATATADSKAAEASQRSSYLAGLTALGFERPGLNNALISYTNLTSQRSFTDGSSYSFPDKANPSGTVASGSTGVLKDILCNMVSTTSTYLQDAQHCDAKNSNCSAAQMCGKILADFGALDSAALATNYRFREKITYTFTGLRAGMMLANHPALADGVTNYVRSSTDQDIQFEPRAIYIPGDLTVKPITKVSYCKSIDIDSADDTLISSNTPHDFIGPEALGGAGINIYGANFNGYPELNTSAQAHDNFAPNLTIYPWSNSFMRVKTIPGFRSQNSACAPVEVDHVLNQGENNLIQKLRSLNGVLITAQGSSISVYFSPVKVPKDTASLTLKESLSPGLYLPQVNVSPMTLTVGSGLYQSSLWSGAGVPKRTFLDSLNANPWAQNFSNVDASIHAQFGLGISYYALPLRSGVPDPTADSSYPARSFKAELTRTLSGGLPTSDSDVRTASGNSTVGAPRYIKSLMRLDLAVGDLAANASTTTTHKENVRGYGSVFLTNRLGGKTQAAATPAVTCLNPSLINTLKYPTKLISRRAMGTASNPGNQNLPFGRDGDMNVVVDDEVSSATDSANNYINNLYFTRAFIPTTMRINGAGTIEEPINLAQDYNSFLAQIQTNSSISRVKSSGQASELVKFDSNGGRAYDRTLTLKGVLANLRIIGDRAPSQPLYNTGDTGQTSQEWKGIRGRPPQDSSEDACFNDPSRASNYCFEYISTDIYRANQVPFSVVSAGGTVAPANVFEVGSAINTTRVPLFRGVRPFDQFFQIGTNPTDRLFILNPLDPSKVQFDVKRWKPTENPANLDCDASGAASWLTRNECYQNFNYFAGQFFPFLRTRRWIYWGDHTSHGNSNTAYMNPTLRVDVAYNGVEAEESQTKVNVPSKYPPPGNRDISSGGLPKNLTAKQFWPDDSYVDKVVGGPGNTDDGGASYNPGGHFLPPFGVKGASLRLSRFLSTYNRNCGDIRDEANFNAIAGIRFFATDGFSAVLGGPTIFPTNLYCFDNTNGLTASLEVHQYEAAFHLFQGSGRDLDIFAGGGAGWGAGQGEDIQNNQAPGDAALTNEQDLSWVGTSGFIFNDCTDNLDSSEAITPTNQAVPSVGIFGPNIAGLQGDFTFGFFPTGLTPADEGGVYFGPLVGTNLEPYFGHSLSSSNSSPVGSYYTNALMVLPGARGSAGVPLYNPAGHAGQIITGDFSQSPVPLTRNSVASRQTSVGRILQDAAADLTTSGAVYDYEPLVGLVPEVLAAFFIHSDFGDSGEIASGANLNPYQGVGNQSRPFYFDQLIGSFISPVEKKAISDYGFQKNQFAVADGRYVRPMIFSFQYLNSTLPTSNYLNSVRPPIRFAWALDGMSLHMSVVNMNVAKGPDGTVSGIASGVGVAYSSGGGGVFGYLTDSGTIKRSGFADDVAVRSGGLEDNLLRDTKLVLHQFVGSGGTNVTYYVDPNEQESGPRPWTFAENYCAARRATSYLKSAHNFALLRSATGDANPVIGPYDQICVNSAIAVQPTIENTANPDNALISTPSNLPILVGSLVGPSKSVSQTTSGDVTQNLYWQFVKRDQAATIPVDNGSHDPDNPPLCPSGILKSQIFQVTGNSPSTTFTASSGWRALDGTVADNIASGNPTCPLSINGRNQHEVGRIYANLYTDPSVCYGSLTGSSIPDLRPLSGGGQRVSSCPVPAAGFCSLPGVTSQADCLAKGGTMVRATADTFNATTVELPPGQYHRAGVVQTTSYNAPSGALSNYSIFVGTRQKDFLSVANIRPSSLVVRPDSGDFDAASGLWWQADDNTASAPPRCDVIPYDPDSGIDAAQAPDGKPTLSATWSFLEVARRWGSLDSYFVKTTAKQTLITSFSDAGTAATIANAADSCNWSAGVGQAGGPASAVPQLRAGASPAPGTSAPSDYQSFTSPVGYDWLAGASSTVTTRQFTPWSSERTDGTDTNPPDCSIFNDASALARENSFPMTAAALAANNLFTLGTPPHASTYQINPKGAPDSSLNNAVPSFATGGYWSSIGTEQLELTKANSTIPVNCQIFIDPASGQDRCDSNIPLTYQTVEGYQLTTRAEGGEHGGNAGQAVVLTTFKPSQLSIKTDAGLGGAAGGTSLLGIQAKRNLVCYQASADPLNPSMKIYRFNKSVVSVAPAGPGSDGLSGGNQSFFGWGIMPEAADWLKKTIIDGASKAQQAPGQ